MTNRVIEVGVYGGLVQWVRGIPKGVDVRVHDFDVDGVDDGIISRDSDGNACVVVVYEGGEDDSDLRELPG
jgi:hypothetical protein